MPPAGEHSKTIELELTKSGSPTLHDDIMSQIDGYARDEVEKAWNAFVDQSRFRRVA